MPETNGDGPTDRLSGLRIETQLRAQIAGMLELMDTDQLAKARANLTDILAANQVSNLTAQSED